LYNLKKRNRKIKKQIIFFLICKVNDENSRLGIHDPDPDPDKYQYPDPDPSVTGMDTQIRIRIHTKMSWIHNTA
jgi:hypothetical protein